MEKQTPQTLDTSSFFTELTPLVTPDPPALPVPRTSSSPPAPRILSNQEAFDDIFFSLDRFQREATVAQGHVLCAARPGSGKTRVLVARLLRGILEHGPEKVTAITFTRASAVEMRNRLSMLIGPAAQKLTVSTFHSLALEAIRRHSRSRIIDERDRFLVITRLLQTRHIYYPVDRFIVAIPDYFNHDQSIISRLPEGVVMVLEDYDAYLQSNRLLDLDALVPTMADYVQSDAIRVKSRLLLVDEFQDVDPAQVRLIAAIAHQGADTFCVGDDDQSIYGFRRSLGPEAFHLLQKKLDAKILFLSTNYRCAKAIAKTAEHPLLNLSDRIDKPLTIHRDGGIVSGLHFPNPDAEMMAAAHYCSEQAALGRSVALLSRTNGLLDSMEGILRLLDIPYSRTDNKSFWDGPHVRKCLAFLSLPFKPNAHDLYVALHTLPIPHDTVKGVMTHFNQNLPSTFTITDLMDNLYDRSITADMEVEHAEHFRQWRVMFSDWVDACLGDDQWESASRFFQEVVSHARKQGMISTATILNRYFTTPNQKGELMPVKTRLQHLAMPQSFQDDETPNAMRLVTIHGSKGLEYELVWILGARKGIIPHEDAESEDEERRIFYVGMTRAMDELIVSNAATAPDTPDIPFSFNWQPPEVQVPTA